MIACIWLLHAPRVSGWMQSNGSRRAAPTSAVVVAGDGSLKHRHGHKRHAKTQSTFRAADEPATERQRRDLGLHQRAIEEQGPLGVALQMAADVARLNPILYVLPGLVLLLALLATPWSKLLGTFAIDAECAERSDIQETGFKLDMSTCAASVRVLSIFAVCVVTLALIVVVQVDAALNRARVEQTFGIDVVDFDHNAPNLHHIWRRRNPALAEVSNKAHVVHERLLLTPFGKDMIRLKDHGWLDLCKIDSDGDGMSNGAELGDPCCTWVPGKVEPYRVWNLSDPSEASDPIEGNPSPETRKAAASRYMNDLRPPSCEEPFDVATRSRQFHEQYYMTHEQDRAAPDGLRLFKYPCFLVTAILLGDWILRKGLLRDLFGFGPKAWNHPTDLQATRRLSIWSLAYLWTDGVAGLVHLTFDFCPRTYPFFGSVATGFQYHHKHPTAWAVVPLPVMLSHSLPLMGILSATLAVTQQKRCFRAFWTLTLVFFVMTVLTHRWVHMPPEGNYEWFKILQQTGLLMSHEHHMKHHDSLVQQFSNLSGVTDFILDYLCSLVPAWQYQHWLTATLVYFAVPIVAGASALAEGLPGDDGLSKERAQKQVKN